MILFHGSPTIVCEPRILKPGRTLDYGTGFYTTTSEQQASDWALRRVKDIQTYRPDGLPYRSRT